MFLESKITLLKIAGIRISKDGRCGFPNLAWDGGPVAECDSKSGDPCCSPVGFCGISDGHCKCERCIDFRTPNSRKSNLVHEVSKQTSSLYV